jgi:hypothetical protein
MTNHNQKLDRDDVFRNENYIYRELCEYFDGTSGLCLAKDSSVSPCDKTLVMCEIIHKIVV